MEINIHLPNVSASEDSLREEVEQSLKRFAEWLTRVDVYVKDENGDKGGHDTRCTIEARPRGLDPVAAEGHAASAKEAVTGAAKKLQRQLENILDKRSDHHRG